MREEGAPFISPKNTAWKAFVRANPIEVSMLRPQNKLYVKHNVRLTGRSPSKELKKQI